MASDSEFNMSKLSLNSEGSAEDWDRSLMRDDDDEEGVAGNILSSTTPRNSVAFPAGLKDDITDTPKGVGKGGKRTLSELLKMHAEKGTDCNFSTEEASRLAEVLGQWINASSSPYEDDDDFFNRSHDDISIHSKRPASSTGNAHQRGQSDSSRPSSSAGKAAA